VDYRTDELRIRWRGYGERSLVDIDAVGKVVVVAELEDAPEPQTEEPEE